MKINYSEYQDTIFGDNPELKTFISGKAPSALGVDTSFLQYSKFQDLLFEKPNQNALTSIDEAMSKSSNLVDQDTIAKYKKLIKFENGKPVFETKEPVAASFFVENIE